MIQRIYKLDILYGLLLTFGLAQVLQGGDDELLRQLRRELRRAGSAFRRRSISASCICRFIAASSCSRRSSFAAAPGSSIEKTRLGALLRAATENPIAGAVIRRERAAADRA